MTIFDVSNEIGWLTFGGLKVDRFANSGGDDEIPAGWNHCAWLQLDDNKSSILRNRPDDSDPLQCLGSGWWWLMMKKRQS